MIDIHLFEQLVAFASRGTLSAAAEQLHISQPALSRAMQRLEDELGVRLFDRQKSRLFLNENGELAVTYARNLLLQESAMIEQIREFDRKKRTIFVGSCTPILLPDFVSLLSRIYEGMTISTKVNGDLERLKDGLRENVYQLAFQQKKPDEAEFYSFPVETERLYVYLPPAHPLADSPGLYLKELDGQPFLLYSQIGFWDALCRREMPSSRFLMQQEMDVLGELVENSALPAFTTDYILKREGNRTGRIAVPILDEDANVTYYCTCLRSSQARFRAVFQHFQSQASAAGKSTGIGKGPV